MERIFKIEALDLELEVNVNRPLSAIKICFDKFKETKNIDYMLAPEIIGELVECVLYGIEKGRDQNNIFKNNSMTVAEERAEIYYLVNDFNNLVKKYWSNGSLRTSLLNNDDPSILLTEQIDINVEKTMEIIGNLFPDNFVTHQECYEGITYEDYTNSTSCERGGLLNTITGIDIFVNTPEINAGFAITIADPGNTKDYKLYEFDEITMLGHFEKYIIKEIEKTLRTHRDGNLIFYFKNVGTLYSNKGKYLEAIRETLLPIEIRLD